MCENVRLLSKRQRRRKVTQSMKKVLKNVNTENNNSNILHSVGYLLSDVSFNIGNNDTIDDDMVVDNVDVLDYENIPITSAENYDFSSIFKDYYFYSAENNYCSENTDENSKDKNIVMHTFAVNPKTFTNNLRRLAYVHNLTHAALDEILNLINPAYTFLPSTAKTLLHTPRKVETISCGNGNMCYFGVEFGLIRKLQNGGLKQNIPTIKLIINIDGLPIFKSSSTNLWPILCRSDDLVNDRPFMIACFCGEGKPSNIEQYLNPFIEEVNSLRKHGFQYNGKILYVEIECFAADAPARAMLKMVKGHTSTYACERCTIKKVKNAKYFPTKIKNSVVLRSNNDFVCNKIDERHIKGKSPLLALNIDMVLQFVLDPMHLVYLGSTKRLLVMYWIEGGRHCKLSRQNISAIDYNIQVIRPFVTADFCRKPRSLVHVHRFKATEFRFFTLYSGPIITYNILDTVKYDHFILLHVAITIFSSVPLIKSYLHVAEESIRQFVCKAPEIYGDGFVVYNIHSLLHLCTDVQTYGPLDRYGCFSFENYLQSIKRRIRSKRLPLEQVCNRIAEEEDIDTEIKSATSNLFIPKQVHYPNLNKVSHFTCEKLIYGDTKLSCKIPDNTVAIGNQIYVINQILYIDGKYKCIGASFKFVEDLYQHPIRSSKLGIYYVRSMNVNNLTTFFVDNISYKCLRMPFMDGFAVFPIIHHVL